MSLGHINLNQIIQSQFRNPKDAAKIGITNWPVWQGGSQTKCSWLHPSNQKKYQISNGQLGVVKIPLKAMPT
jgi:hypothetical protein